MVPVDVVPGPIVFPIVPRPGASELVPTVGETTVGVVLRFIYFFRGSVLVSLLVGPLGRRRSFPISICSRRVCVGLV